MIGCFVEYLRDLVCVLVMSCFYAGSMLAIRRDVDNIPGSRHTEMRLQ